MKEEYPKLYELIAETAEKVHISPDIQSYLWQDNMISVSYLSQGFGGKGKNILNLGFFLLQILNEEELKAIILHELAHISVGDTKINARFNTSIEKFKSFHKVLLKNNKESIFSSFIKSYVENMEIYLEISSKLAEYRADRFAVSHIEPCIFAGALMKIKLMDLYLEENMFDYLEIRHLKEPPQNFYNLFFEAFYTNADRNKDQLIQRIKKQISPLLNTHPSFEERMRTIGILDLDSSIVFLNNAIEYQNELNKMLICFNEIWLNTMDSHWEAYCSEYHNSLDIIESYEITEDEDKNIEYGIALENVGKYEEAIDIYGKMLQRDQNYPPALFRKGFILLKRSDDNGINMIKKAMNLDVTFIPNGLDILYKYFINNGMQKQLDASAVWAQKRQEILEKARNEIKKLSLKDKFKENDLPEDIKNKIIAFSQQFEMIKRVFIVNKVPKYTKKEIHVIGILYLSMDKSEATDILKKLRSEIDIPYFTLDLTQHFQFVEIFAKIDDSLLYEKVDN